MFTYRIDRIIRVFDGDTIEAVLDLGFSIFISLRIRLYGINAPETRTRNKEEKAKGLASKEWLTQRLKSKEEITITTYKEKIITGKDKYGRILGRLFIQGQCINEEMIALGLAQPYEVKEMRKKRKTDKSM